MRCLRHPRLVALVVYAIVIFTTSTLLHGANAGVSNPMQYTNETIGKPEDWELNDHPYFYTMSHVRTKNGTWVVNPNHTLPPFTMEEYYGNVTKRIPFFMRWYVVGESNKMRKGVVKFREYFIFNLVSPMDYGLSERAKSVRRQWHEVVVKFWWKMLVNFVAKDALKGLQNLVFGGVQDWIQERLDRQTAKLNATELALHYNYTLEQLQAVRAAAKDALRVKIMTPYQYKWPSDLGEGAQRGLPEVRRTVTYFQPYERYYYKYYDEEVLPPPTLPAAITYPWPWHQRLAQARFILMDAMEQEASRRQMEMNETAVRQAATQAADLAEKEAEMVEAAPRPLPTTPAPSPEYVEGDNGMQGNAQQQGTDGEDAEKNEKKETTVLGNERRQHRWLEIQDSGSGSGRGSDDSQETGSNSDSASGSDAGNATMAMAVQRRAQRLLREFHFASGIPRMERMTDGYYPVLMPTLDQFLTMAIDENGTMTVDPDAESFLQEQKQNQQLDAGDPDSDTDPDQPDITSINSTTGNGTDFTTRAGVYEAVRAFYSYPSIEISHARNAARGRRRLQSRKLAPFAACSVDAMCAVRSGVTVFTPSLATAAQEIFGLSATTSNDSSTGMPVSPEHQRATRLQWLRRIATEAFDAERRVVESGLVAPSTTWYSFYDRNTDKLADAALGFVNGTRASVVTLGLEFKPLALFEGFTVKDLGRTDQVLLNGASYYRIANVQTTAAMKVTNEVPQHEPLTTSERLALVAFLQQHLEQLNDTIRAFESKRDADAMHRAMVQATQQQCYYDGRLFSLLGYGYLLPATNPFGVAYRDHKIPEPFHLLLRVLVRLAESRLLMEEESLQLVACLAMLRFNVRFYRCVDMANATSAAATNTNGSIVQNETNSSTAPTSPPTQLPEPSLSSSPSPSPSKSMDGDTPPPTAETPTETPRATPQSAALDWR